MDAVRVNLKLYTGERDSSEDALAHASEDTTTPFPVQPTMPDPAALTSRELIRPLRSRRSATDLTPFSAAWFDELEQKRYQRHGTWLTTALEFGRHPGESLLLLGPGLGTDAVHYMRTGTPVTVGVTTRDHPGLIRANLARHALPARIVDTSASVLPFADGTFDVVTWNALDADAPLDPVRVPELFRVLKAGGKVIGLFPAHYDAGYWQDLLLPLQHWYWRRPADPVIGTKATSRSLRSAFLGFTSFKVSKRHLRRSELPHIWRVLPLVLLERLIGRVLVFKALKPLTTRTINAVKLAA